MQRSLLPLKADSVGWINKPEVVNPCNEEVSFDVNVLDYMNVEEFNDFMWNKTNNNYDLLWRMTKSLSLQVKASKALLSFSSKLCAGKRNIEVLDKFVESMKFSLIAVLRMPLPLIVLKFLISIM